MLKNARLNTKISVCFSLLLAFITAVACVVLAEFYRDSSLRQSGLLLQTVGDAAVQQLEMTFDEMDRISARLFFSSEISEAMKDAAASTGQSEYFEEHYSMQDTVRSRIFSIVSTSNSDTTVNLYNRNAFISNRYTCLRSLTRNSAAPIRRVSPGRTTLIGRRTITTATRIFP